MTWYPSASTLIGTLSGAADATLVGAGAVGVLVPILIASVVGVLMLTATVVGVLVLAATVGDGAGVSLVADAQPETSSDRLTRSVMEMERCMNILVCCDMLVLYYNEWYLLCI